eukprot:SAG22_NODE_1569_length_4097_cov_2.299400_1_plen_157_part_00
MALSGSQLAHWEAFGYLHLRSFLPPSETAAVSDEFDRQLEGAAAGQPQAELLPLPSSSSRGHGATLGGALQVESGFVEHSAPLWELSGLGPQKDTRLSAVAEQLLGPGCYYCGSDGIMAFGATGAVRDASPGHQPLCLPSDCCPGFCAFGPRRLAL